MTPTNEALQTFYGTLPLALVIVGGFLRGQTLLKDILERLGRLETRLDGVQGDLGQIKERLVVLETRAGIVFRS